MTTLRSSTLTLGLHRGAPRLWIEGRYLADLGFPKGTPVVSVFGEGEVVIRQALPGETADHLVSGSRKKGNAVLDYNTRRLAEALDSAETVTVETRHGVIRVTPSRAVRALRGRLELLWAGGTPTCGSLFSGGGLLDEAARQAGYESTFGVELNPDYADLWQRNHKGRMYEGCLSSHDLESAPRCALLTLGIPCEPYSVKRRDTGAAAAEAHPNADLAFWALLAIDRLNPAHIVAEEVPGFLAHPVGVVFLATLRRMGYHVHTRTVTGTGYGGLMRRARSAIVATVLNGFEWPEESPPEAPGRPVLGSVLLPPDDPRCEWWGREKKGWLFDHWEKQLEKGNGFVSQFLTASTTEVQAITKRYFAGQGDGPVVLDERPGHEGRMRWLDPVEVRRLMGLPDTYDLGTSKTLAGEVMGQGVLVDVFRRIIEALPALQRFT